MAWNIKLHGDSLEREFWDFIEERIPAYKEIWEAYIGNKGDAKIAIMNNISEELEPKRVHFSELHYTCLESLVSLKLLTEESYKDIKSVKDSIEAINKLIVFVAHAGRIKDLIEKICYLFLTKEEADKIINNLNEYYQQRNTVIHGKKIPFGIEGGLYKIVRPKGGSENPAEWDSSFNWNTASVDDLIFLNEFFDETFNQLTTTVNNTLNNIKNSIFLLIRENKLKLSDPPEIKSGSVDITFDGSQSSSGLKLSGGTDN